MAKKDPTRARLVSKTNPPANLAAKINPLKPRSSSKSLEAALKPFDKMRLSTAMILVGLIAWWIAVFVRLVESYRVLTYDWASQARQAQSLIHAFQVKVDTPLMIWHRPKRDPLQTRLAGLEQLDRTPGGSTTMTTMTTMATRSTIRNAIGFLILMSSTVLGEVPGLPDTKPWENRGDSKAAAAEMVEGIHRFLDRETEASLEARQRHWQRDYSSPEAYIESVDLNRRRLEAILGAVDPRVSPVEMHLVGTTEAPALLADSERFEVFAVRWNVYSDVQAEGLLLEPKGEAIANIVALPDCDTLPEQYAGLVEGLPADSQMARLLAEAGCRVLVPVLLDRDVTFSGNPSVRLTNLTHREWIWRQAFETGRHPIGYEVDKVRAAVDWFTREGEPDRPVGVVGLGEGGLIALYTGALDTRIDATWVAGYFASRQNLWQEPIDRSVWGLLDEFGDAEIASLIAPRTVLIEPCLGPEVTGPPPEVDGRSFAASGRIVTPPQEVTVEEVRRLRAFLGVEDLIGPLLITTHRANEPPLHNYLDHLRSFFLSEGLGLAGPTENGHFAKSPKTAWPLVGPLPDPIARMGRQVKQLQDHTQALIRTSELRRDEFWALADSSSPEAWAESIQDYRDTFWNEVIGRFPEPSEPINPQSVQVLDTQNWTGHAVRLDVWPDVVASGILLLPKDLEEGEKRPVVVCQHGLEGLPDPIVDPAIDTVYHSYGAKLADLGYIVYAPQNPYIGVDRFRQLQRKAHPLKKSLFGVIVRQHERTLQWLKTLPNVDPNRIAFYGLSYGGKTAMRVPALLEDYCLSICSADFNEWVVKCTNLDRRYSYMFTIEYDMYEWDLAGGFNYAEMAGLIAPRPFQVERGHQDGVAPDEWIGYEYAKVKRLYDTLGLPDQTDITYFNGGHMIKAEGTFEFLAKHLNWPRGKPE